MIVPDSPSVASSEQGRGALVRSFFRELRRRNVYRAGAAYAVAGWLVVQIATQVLPIFEVSPLVLRIIVLVIIAGFPLVLVLSWIYEVTPEGIVKTDEVAPSESITRRTGQRLNTVIIGTLAVAVLFLLAQRYLFPQRSAETKAPVSDKSIAVLPFDNLSDDKANAYFAEGIQDEILTRLAKVGALKVISRTSTQHYASKPDNLPEIARQLGVANILEGSVQKIGDAVHVNVQLIRAATDDHLWAEIYNRKLDDIFSVQGEVAGAIAQALNATLSGAEHAALTDKPTQNVAAHDAYLRARALETAGYDYAVTRKQVEAYNEAVRLDPNFALAWANLAAVEGYLYLNGIDPQIYTVDSIKHATDTALALQPQLTEAQIAQGSFRYRILRDFAGAQESFEAVLRQSPNNGMALQLLGLVERRQGHWDQALVHLQQAAVLDPRNAGLLMTIGGETFANMHRFDEAREWLDRALALEPGDALTIGYKAYTYMAEGRLDEAARILDPIAAAGIAPNLGAYRVYLRLLQRRNADAIAEAQALLAQPELNGLGPQIALYLGFAQLGAGKTAEARTTFEKLVAEIEPFASRVDDALTPTTLALAYAGVGNMQAALKQAHHAVDIYGSDAIQLPTAHIALIQVQGLAGDRDAAIAAIESVLREPAGDTRALLRLDPLFDSLRGDARFDKLIAADAATAQSRAPQ
jgi:TolB-like protein/Flp pilus assembly protein TadD